MHSCITSLCLVSAEADLIAATVSCIAGTSARSCYVYSSAARRWRHHGSIEEVDLDARHTEVFEPGLLEHTFKTVRVSVRCVLRVCVYPCCNDTYLASASATASAA